MALSPYGAPMMFDLPQGANINLLTQPLQQGLQAYRQGMDKQFEGERELKQEQQADERLNIAKQQAADARQERMMKSFGNMVMAVVNEPDEAKAQSYWQRIKAIPEFAKEAAAAGLDLNDHRGTARIVAARAGVLPDPLEQQQKQAAIAASNASTALHTAQAKNVGADLYDIKDGVVFNKRTGEVRENTGGKDEFKKEAAKVDAKRLSEFAEQGQVARVAHGDLDRLDELGAAIGTQGAVANVKAAFGPYANALGLKIDGLDEIQAFSSIVSRLAPTMRPPGSGATSDFEFKQFINALPQLSQTVQGRKLALDQMRAMNTYKVQVGEISEKMLTGDIDRKTGMEQLRKLGNPLTLWRQGSQALPPAQPQGASRFAQPQMSPAGALVNSVRQQIQNGQVDLPQVIEQARQALQQGRDPGAVRLRLQEIGIDPAQVGL